MRVSVLWVGSVSLMTFLAVANSGPGARASESASFESLVEAASTAPELGALVAPFINDCKGARREIDRARCRQVDGYLRARLPQRSFVAVVDSPHVISVSDYDAAAKGYRMRVIGCLTCDEPLAGGLVDKRFVTLKVPVKSAETMGTAVALAQPVMSFESLEQAKAWDTTVKPNLRAQFVFKAEGTTWNYRQNRGVAFTPIGSRIFDRCTGDVVYSQPPSTGKVAVVEGQPGCNAVDAKTVSTLGQARKQVLAKGDSKEGKEQQELPEKLGATEITTALDAVRKDLGACDTQFRMRGSVDLEFDVTGSGGAAQAVRARGQLGGTDVAQCLLQAAHRVQFPQFHEARQTFKFSVRLQGK